MKCKKEENDMANPSVTWTIGKQKNIALIAHDSMKPVIIEWCEKNKEILKEHFLPYRDEMIISTKAGYTMWEGPYGDWGSRKYLLASLDQSLKRMGLEYVDIFYHHRMDPNTPLEETMGALEQAVRSGKALYVGLSNYDGPTLEKAAAILTDMRVPFVINQNRYNILDRTVEKNGLKETAPRLGKGIICFTPLAQGVLTDRYLNGIPEDSRVRTDSRFLKESSLTAEKIERVRGLNEIAKRRGQTLAEMALAWILKDGAVTSALIGASKPAQILDNIKALENTTFTAEELAQIEQEGKTFPVECQFCDTVYSFTPEDIAEILRKV